LGESAEEEINYLNHQYKYNKMIKFPYKSLIYSTLIFIIIFLVMYLYGKGSLEYMPDFIYGFILWAFIPAIIVFITFGIAEINVQKYSDKQAEYQRILLNIKSVKIIALILVFSNVIGIIIEAYGPLNNLTLGIFDSAIFEFLNTYLLLPSLILYFNLVDYSKSIGVKKELNFMKVFLKGVLTTFLFVGVLFLLLFNCRGEACFGLVTLPFYFVGGVIISLVVTSIFYFRSKKNINF